MRNPNVIVVGGGPAGLLAAGRAAELGKRVLLLEKMEREGRKLLITGKGRCNITNDLALQDFITHIFPNGRFLRNAFSQFFSSDILELLQHYGVETGLERGGRYFPISNKAADVLKALLQWNSEMGVEIQCKQKVENLAVEEGKIKGVIVNGKLLPAERVILATGGKSYPATGSNGEGYDLARRLGHSVEAVRPSLVPLETSGGVAQKLQGLSLKNVQVVLWVDGKKQAELFGEMLFTHFGLSGPVILTLSRMAVDALREKRKVEITIDLKPALNEEKLDKRLQRELNENGKKKISNIFSQLLPSKMIPVFLELLELDPEMPGHQVSGKQRKKIRHLLKNLSFQVTNHRSFKEAIITAGGIPCNEIRPKTMESKLVQGLHFAGEIIDLDGETGGFNLQIAYSTGWLAGNA